ncbi:DUF6121 family protein [Frigoribacterium sp. Leaf164]|uniref:DUF6121 family protein n=1 Tax=Frigoribacterium sp. Leaf164 TaxID=1736282 RepID=UPI0012E1A067|nr:DUF6121 family protein [Frigoribacterium sp. Leaf164]
MTRAVSALMGTVLFAALLIATAGFESLLLDRDVISEPDAGTLLGPAMAAAALLVVLLALMRSAAVADRAEGRAPESRGTFPAQPADGVGPGRPAPTGTADGPGAGAPRTPAPRLLPPALVTALLVWAAMVVVGSVGYALVRDDGAAAVLFAGRYVLSPFVLGSALWAGLVVLGVAAASRVDPSRGSPRSFD